MFDSVVLTHVQVLSLEAALRSERSKAAQRMRELQRHIVLLSDDLSLTRQRTASYEFAALRQGSAHTVGLR